MILKLFRKKFRDYYKPYWYLALLRVVLVFLPQTGYIHPDEFFQSIEVLIGHFFEFEVSKPWEFKTTFPIRSMTIPYIIIGASLNILKTVNILSRLIFNIKIITPYTLILFPRLMVCLLSFLVDWCLYKICVNNNEKYKSRILILASSYVMLVFGTRTFSNTIELILFALLLYYVADSMTFTNIIVRQHEYLNKRYQKCKTDSDKAKIHKLKLFLASHSLRNCFPISTITVMGFFNRPTFLFFAVFPVFLWLYRGIGFKSVISLHFHLRMLMVLACAIPTILFFICFDSLYYGYLSLAEVEFFTVSINNFVFTPLNFIKYNLNHDNLALHGKHPRYLHFIVNIPLLFNILGVLALIELGNIVHKLVKKKFHLLPTVRSIKALMTVSFFAPVALLSLFPHHEARFIIPIVLPLIYLFGNSILQEPDFELVQVSKESLTIEFLERKLKEKSYAFLKIWLITNTICLVFFGFIHQGGVISATSHLAKEMQTKPASAQFQIFSSHIYSIPESLFMQMSSEKIYQSNKSKYKIPKRVVLFEEGSKDLAVVVEKIQDILIENYKTTTLRHNYTYIVLPSSLRNNLEYLTLDKCSHLHLQECTHFYPHLSTEALPSYIVFMENLLNFKYFQFSNVYDTFVLLIKSFGLTVCEVEYY